MTYKIKRPVSSTYIPLSDEIEKMLDIQYEINPDAKGLIVRYEILR